MNARQEILNKKKPTRATAGRRDILTVRGLKDQDEFYYRWINDVGDRLYQCLEDGYTFVDKKGLEAGDRNVETARGTESVLKKGVGRGTVAYLMKIPREVYDAFKAEELRERVFAVEDAMKEKEKGQYGSIEVEQRAK